MSLVVEVWTLRCLSKYLLRKRKYNNILERDAFKYICSREWRLWTFILNDLWCIYSPWVLFFYGEEELECNSTFMIFWVVLWTAFHSFYTAKGWRYGRLWEILIHLMVLVNVDLFNVVYLLRNNSYNILCKNL